jgi:hypothetical protein
MLVALRSLAVVKGLDPRRFATLARAELAVMLGYARRSREDSRGSRRDGLRRMGAP